MRSITAICAVALLALMLSPGIAGADPGTTIVVDRIDDGEAILLVETDGSIDEQRLVDADALPEEGRHEGAVLERVDDGYAYDAAATERRRADAESRFDRLAEGDGDDGGAGFGLCRLGPLGRLGWC